MSGKMERTGVHFMFLCFVLSAFLSLAASEYKLYNSRSYSKDVGVQYVQSTDMNETDIDYLLNNKCKFFIVEKIIFYACPKRPTRYPLLHNEVVSDVNGHNDRDEVYGHSQKFECPFSFGTCPHPKDCRKYYLCIFDKPRLMTCESSKLYDEYKRECAKNSTVDCGDRTGDVTTKGTTRVPGQETTSGVKTTTKKVEKFKCPYTWGTFPNPDDCSQYYLCLNKRHTRKKCRRTELYDTKTKECRDEDKVDCGSRFNPREKTTKPLTTTAATTRVTTTKEEITSGTFQVSTSQSSSGATSEQRQTESSSASVPSSSEITDNDVTNKPQSTDQDTSGTVEPEASSQRPTTSDEGTDTNEPEPSSERPTTSDEGTDTNEPEPSSERPTTSDEGTDTNEPEPSSERPTTSDEGTDTNEPEPSSERPTTSDEGTDTNEPEPSSERPTTSDEGTDTNEPEPSSERPTTSDEGTDTNEPEPSSERPTTSDEGTDTNEPEPSSERPTTSDEGTDTNEPEPSSERPTTSDEGTDTNEPEPSSERPTTSDEGTDTNEPEPSSERPTTSDEGTDTNEPEPSSERPTTSDEGTDTNLSKETKFTEDFRTADTTEDETPSKESEAPVQETTPSGELLSSLPDDNTNTDVQKSTDGESDSTKVGTSEPESTVSDVASSEEPDSPTENKISKALPYSTPSVDYNNTDDDDTETSSQFETTAKEGITPETSASTVDSSEISSSDQVETSATSLEPLESFVCPKKKGNFPHKDCSLYYACRGGSHKIEKCPTGTLFHSTFGLCYNEDDVDCEDRNKDEGSTVTYISITSSTDRPMTETIGDNDTSSEFSVSFDSTDKTTDYTVSEMPKTQSTSDFTVEKTDITSSFNKSDLTSEGNTDYSTEDINYSGYSTQGEISSETTTDFTKELSSQSTTGDNEHSDSQKETTIKYTDLSITDADVASQTHSMGTTEETPSSSTGNIEISTTNIATFTEDEPSTQNIVDKEDTSDHISIVRTTVEKIISSEIPISTKEVNSSLIPRTTQPTSEKPIVSETTERESYEPSETTQEHFPSSTKMTSITKVPDATTHSEKEIIASTLEPKDICYTTDKTCIVDEDGNIFRCPKSHGHFSHPWDFSKFIHCDSFTIHVFDCPAGLRFDPKNKICTWPAPIKG